MSHSKGSEKKPGPAFSSYWYLRPPEVVLFFQPDGQGQHTRKDDWIASFQMSAIRGVKDVFSQLNVILTGLRSFKKAEYSNFWDVPPNWAGQHDQLQLYWFEGEDHSPVSWSPSALATSLPNVSQRTLGIRSFFPRTKASFNRLCSCTSMSNSSFHWGSVVLRHGPVLNDREVAPPLPCIIRIQTLAFSDPDYC